MYIVMQRYSQLFILQLHNQVMQIRCLQRSLLTNFQQTCNFYTKSIYGYTLTRLMIIQQSKTKFKLISQISSFYSMFRLSTTLCFRRLHTSDSTFEFIRIGHGAGRDQSRILLDCFGKPFLTVRRPRPNKMAESGWKSVLCMRNVLAKISSGFAIRVPNFVKGIVLVFQ